MRAVVTRVSEANVAVEGEIIGKIGRGFLVLLGVGPTDTEETTVTLAKKITATRVFADDAGKMNLDLATVGGELLVVSQFTLYADLKSRRPGFSHAAKPDLAERLYEKFVACCKENGFNVECGIFGADMQVSSVNDGPVTLLFDTKK